MEPGVMRANRNMFDCADQIWDRMTALYLIGHIERSNKLEIIVSGGTWTSYPEEYREEFCRDVFYAANTFWDAPLLRRSRKTLTEEKAINEDAACRVVGLTIETRPDTICDAELVRLRHYGCTRVQLGIQHVDDDVLIRELHVYGSFAQIGETSTKIQHQGIGKTLMARAENIARSQGYGKIAVISSEGTRGYYKKLGYENESHFMTKTVHKIK